MRTGAMAGWYEWARGLAQGTVARGVAGARRSELPPDRRPRRRAHGGRRRDGRRAEPAVRDGGVGGCACARAARGAGRGRARRRAGGGGGGAGGGGGGGGGGGAGGGGGGVRGPPGAGGGLSGGGGFSCRATP